MTKNLPSGLEVKEKKLKKVKKGKKKEKLSAKTCS
jgi:hypothetical protein